MTESCFHKVIKTPIGDLHLVASQNGLRAIHHKSFQKPDSVKTSNTNAVLNKAEKQLKEYFKGIRKTFDIPLEPEGTSFQIKVWKELRRIPYGKTISYGEQAKNLGDKKKARAVGSANGKNPISIIVPCHRVIGANGNLAGFGWGLEIKRFLLDLEFKNNIN